jgi:uncharacterized membrane protein
VRLRLLQWRDALAGSFWFVPLAMALVAGAAALGSVALDHAIGEDWVRRIGWVWSGGADGARGVLSVVAGSSITVVSIVFSLTVTALAQTSSHYGSRVLRNFIGNRFVQFTLGTFVATFVYCLLVLRTVRSVEESSFVPYLSVNVGVGLALASLGVLIFFIHHVSLAIQAETLVAGIGEELERTLPVLFPERAGESASGAASVDLPDPVDWEAAADLQAHSSGYVQAVDDERLLALAAEQDLVLKLDARPGDFVARHARLGRVHACVPAREPDCEALRECFTLGSRRSPQQDALFLVHQLVEVAARALSPGVNEPFTALGCIDWLGAALRGFAGRELPAGVRVDAQGRVRLLAPALDFEQAARASLDPIRRFGAADPEVMLRLLQVIASVAPALHRDRDRAALVRHARLIDEDAERIANPSDRQRVTEAMWATVHVLTGASSR